MVFVVLYCVLQCIGRAYIFQTFQVTFIELPTTQNYIFKWKSSFYCMLIYTGTHNEIHDKISLITLRYLFFFFFTDNKITITLTVDKELDKSQLHNVFVVISKYNVLYKVSSRYVKRLLRYNLYEKTGTFVLFSW